MNPIALTHDAYATVRALQIHERMRASLITVVVQRELVAHTHAFDLWKSKAKTTVPWSVF
jgi:hypothetical protein